MTEETLFADALDAPDRAAFLDTHCPDPAVRRKVEELLAAHDAASGFLRSDPDATQTHEPTPLDTDVLPRLGPPTRPNSLGRLGHYEVLEVVGSGGFGTVLKAFDDRLHRVVAVKVLAAAYAASGPARARFLREGRSAAAVRDTHVVSVHAVTGDDEAVPYLVMEYIAGQTLQQKLDKVGPLPPAEVLRIGGQIARGLAAAHATGLIHRDVKPANILLENGVERVKLSDFGLARAADDASISQSGVVAGTPLYMSPEQARGEAIDHRSDLFSLGSVLYAMCTGRPPFRAESALAVLKRVAEDDPRPLRQVNPQVPPWLADVVAKLHAKEPAGRFQSATEVADLLAGYQAELAQRGTVTPHPAVGGRPARRRRRWPVAAGLLAAAGLVLAMLWLTPFVSRFAANEAVATFEPADGILAVIPMQDGQAVADFHDPRRHPEMVLPPGRYTFEPTLAPGRAVERWEVRFHGPDSRGRAVQYQKAPELDLSRGDRVTVRAVMANDPAAATKPLDPAVWGTFVNPTGNGLASPLPDGRGILGMTGWVAHELNPATNLFAPRLMREVSGDFRIETAVSAFDPAPVGTGHRPGNTWRAAGIVVWQDENTFFRFERAAHTEQRDGAPYLRLEAFPDGTVDKREYLRVRREETYLQVERRGDTFTLRTSEDGQTCRDWHTVRLPLGRKLQVGLVACNGSTELFVAGFRPPTLLVPPPPADWGTLTDPLGTSRVIPRADDTIEFALDGKASQMLHPVTNRDAPRLLADVDGDFRLETAVPPFAPPRPDTGHSDPNGAAWRAAGLVVWQDDGRFLRFDRMAAGLPVGERHYLAVAPFGLNTADTTHPIINPTDVHHLQIERRGDRWTFRGSADGQTWADLRTIDRLPFARKLKVGVLVMNDSREPMTARIRRPTLTPLVTPPPADGFVSLFNGKDKSGWVRSPLPQLGEWEVKDGILEGRTRQRDYLFTERGDYRDFHLRVEAKVTPGGDGGLLFRCERGLTSKFGTAHGYETEISTLKDAPHGTLRLGPEGPDNTVLAKAIADRAGQWFTQEVIVRGNHIVVKVDGETVLDHTTAKEHYARGHLGLQVWGENTVVQFRKVEVKELAADGFVSLFTGTDLTGWKAHPNAPGDWRVEDGAVVGRGDGRGNTSFLFSEAQYADFHLRVEAKTDAFGDGGVYFRAPFEVRVTPAANEPVLAGYMAQLSVRPNWQAHTGSLLTEWPKYALAPRGGHRPDEWVVLEVIAEGNRLRTLVNGRPAAEYRDERTRFARGHLALHVWGNTATRVRFRKVEIKELPAEATGLPATWQRFRVPGADFSVMLPPDPESREAPLPGGWKGMVYGAEVPRGGDPFAVMTVPMDAKTKDELARDPDEAFRRQLRGAVAPGAMEFTALKRITSPGGLKGGEMVLRHPDTGKHYFLRVFVIHDSVGILFAGGDTATPTPMIRAYLDSVRVEERPAAPPMAVAPFDADQAKAHQEAWAKHLGVPVEFTNAAGLTFRLVPPGRFRMGSTPEQAKTVLAATKDSPWAVDTIKAEVPPRMADVREPFYLGTAEVSTGQFRRFADATGYKTEAERSGGGDVWSLKAKAPERKPEYTWRHPQFAPTADHPAAFIGMGDAKAFCEWLGKQDGRRYAVPTDEQWEYACRAGTDTLWFTGDDPAGTRPSISIRAHQPPGGRRANPFGLFDMCGNMQEWATAPDGDRLRGGGSGVAVWFCRSAIRPLATPVVGVSYGFRVAIVGDLRAAAAPPPADGFVPLFNGKDLTGWKTHPDAPGKWVVENGVLKGTEPGFLFSDREYANFNLRAVARVNPGGDGSLCVRAPRQIIKVGPKGAYFGIPDCYVTWLTKGTNVQIRPAGSVGRAGPPGGNSFPTLGVTAADLVRPGEWFTFELIADGNRFATRIDGKEAVNCADPDDKYARGHLALCSFAAGTTVEFRSVELKELPARAAAKPAALPTWLDLIRKNTWPNGSTVTVGLMGTAPAAEAAVRAAAADWGRHANLRFEFPADASKAMIRVTTDPRYMPEPIRPHLQAGKAPGSSALGRNALDRTQFPDASFWLDPGPAHAANLAGTAKHEFGHALGLGHEQDRVNPAQGYGLNYGPTGTPLDNFDPLSVMIHPDDPKDVPAGKATKQNLELSAQDKTLIAAVYPGREPPTWLDALKVNAWPVGETLTVGFVDPAPRPAAAEAAVRTAIADWAPHANLAFEFVPDAQADAAAVRVTFDPKRMPEAVRAKLKPGGLSDVVALGTFARDRTKFPDATFYLDAAPPDPALLPATARHAVGHVLGLVHEQDRTEPRGKPGGYRKTGTPLDRFDPFSVMVQPEGGGDVPGKPRAGRNVNLSEPDKELISAVYPGRGAGVWAPTTPGIPDTKR